MRFPLVGKTVFAAAMVSVGLEGLARHDFGAFWQPVWRGTPAHAALVYLTLAVALAGGLGLLFRSTAAMAARVLLVTLAAWLLVFRLPRIVLAPMAVDAWENAAENAVLVAGAWALYASVARPWDRRHAAYVAGERGLRLACVIYGLAMIVFGVAHFAYVKETALMVPAWLPAPTAWAELTGGAYLAAGAAVLAGPCARLAAGLSTWQMGMFTLLVWAPIVVKGAGVLAWNEALISLSLTAAGWVVAESYRGSAGSSRSRSTGYRRHSGSA
ncbi:MAG TPA: hypothetical protein VH328_07200 [Burkholderiaceae bacterium]|jgi:uncharacterized membrane protein|nr:hypothetical protein [Burkholderiaceae bacterium]